MLFPLAYIDPGSGSFLLQMALAGVLGTLATIRVFWSSLAHRVRWPFGRERPGSSAIPSHHTEDRAVPEEQAGQSANMRQTR